MGRLDDPCANVRSLAIECLPLLEVNRNDELFSETSHSTLAEAVISRLFLYLDDPYIKIRPILLGKTSKISINFRLHRSLFINEFNLFFSLDSLSIMAKKHPVVFENETNKLPSNYLYNDVINELKKLRLE